MTTGRYADAYGAGSGPTAHCAPLHPVLLSFLFRIFGTGARGALAMRVFGSTAAAAGFALLPALAVAGGLGLCSLALLYWKRYAFAWVVIPVFVAYPAVYYVIQVSGRYRFPLESILFLLAANVVSGNLGSSYAKVSNFIRNRHESVVTAAEL